MSPPPSARLAAASSSGLVLLVVACAPRGDSATQQLSAPIAVAPSASTEANDAGAEPKATPCGDAADLGEPRDLPTGFRVRFPESWDVVAQPFGVVGHDPGGRMRVGLSGTFPSEDLEHQMSLVDTSVVGATIVQDWREDERRGMRVVSRVVARGGETAAISFHVAGKGHVLATVDTHGSDTTCSPVAAAILDSLEVGAPFDLRTLRDDLATCPKSVAEVPANGGVCLDGAVLGAEVVERCGRALESQGWSPADGIGQKIPGATEARRCYAAPP